LNIPLTVGVPLMVMVFVDQMADTPVGSPLAPDIPLFKIPVTPVVAWVILGMAVRMHTFGFDEAELAPFTVIVPEVLVPLHPPVTEML
jgi:hypothetical protein